jgi:hypothetical protein
MPRRPSQITQADVARVIRAAKQAGAVEVVVRVGDQSLRSARKLYQRPYKQSLLSAAWAGPGQRQKSLWS